MKYIVDFDGTIVDLWPRYYQVFCDINKVDFVSFDKYVNYKRQYSKDSIVAEKLGITLSDDYFCKKRNKLEEMEYLKKDNLLIKREKLLNFFQNNNSCILTKRRNINNFYKELEYLKLNELINKSFVIEDDKKTKIEWIKNNIFDEDFTIVGDGIEEYNVRSMDKSIVYMVNSGILDTNLLEDLKIKKIDSFNSFIDMQGVF